MVKPAFICTPTPIAWEVVLPTHGLREAGAPAHEEPSPHFPSRTPGRPPLSPTQALLRARFFAHVPRWGPAEHWRSHHPSARAAGNRQGAPPSGERSCASKTRDRPRGLHPPGRSLAWLTADAGASAVPPESHPASTVPRWRCGADTETPQPWREAGRPAVTVTREQCVPVGLSWGCSECHRGGGGSG